MGNEFEMMTHIYFTLFTLASLYILILTFVRACKYLLDLFDKNEPPP